MLPKKREKKEEVVGIMVESSSLPREIDLSPFIDCLQAQNRWDLASRIGVLTYRIMLGDIFKKTSEC